MTLIRENLRAATVANAETLRARLSVPRGLIPLKPDGSFFTYNGVKVDNMLSFDLRDELRKRCIDGMKQWVRRNRLMQMELLTAESDVKVYGPYLSRAGTYTDKGYMQRQMARAASAAVGFDETEDINPDLADFVFEATFLTRRHRPVQTKAEA